MHLPTLMRKELLQQRRSLRLLLMCLIGSILALLAIGSEWGLEATRKLLEWSSPSQGDIAPLLAMFDREPALWGAVQSLLKNLPLLSIVIVLAGAGLIASEAKRGELTTVLVRPIAKVNIVLSKFFGLWFSVILGLWTSALLFYLMAHFSSLGTPRTGPFLQLFLLLSLFYSVYTAFVIFASSISPNAPIAAGISFLLITLSNLLGFLPKLSIYAPEGLYQLTVAIAFGQKVSFPPTFTILSNVFWILVFLFAAGQVLERREL